MPAVWLEKRSFLHPRRRHTRHRNAFVEPSKFCSTSLAIINYAIGLSFARTKKANRSDDDSNQSHLSAWSGFLKRLLRPIDQIGQQENLRPKERRRLIIVNRMISLFALCLLIRQVLLLVFDANQDLLSLAGISLLVFCGSILDSQRHGSFFLGKDSFVIRHTHTHYRLASLPLRIRPRRQLDDDHGFHDDQLDSLWSTRTHLPRGRFADRSCLHVGSRSSSALRQPSGAFLRGTRTDFHDRLVFQPGHLLLHGIGGAHDLS